MLALLTELSTNQEFELIIEFISNFKDKKLLNCFFGIDAESGYNAFITKSHLVLLTNLYKYFKYNIDIEKRNTDKINEEVIISNAIELIKAFIKNKNEEEEMLTSIEYEALTEECIIYAINLLNEGLSLPQGN